MPKNILNEKYNLLRPIKTNALVRLGRNMVGGYIVDLDIVEKTDILVTFGFGPEWSFESEFLKIKENSKVVIYDHKLTITPYFKEIWKYLRRFLMFRASFNSLKERYKNLKNYQNFFKQKNVKYYKEKIIHPLKENNCADLSKAMSRLNDNSKIVLKIDIQNNEYQIINQIIEQSNQINLLIIQFYWIDKNETIFIKSIKKLKTKYEIIHIHANNHHDKLDNGLPKMLEITFCNKKFTPNVVGYCNNFPNKELDFSSHPGKQDISFSFNE